ncbi:MAG: GNAT family N-acetyltransferase [Acidimicrobiales bacterium]
MSAAEPSTIERLDVGRVGRRAWVATDADDRPVAYLLASVIDGNAHIDEVSVDPTAAGRGIGRALIEHLTAWATERGLDAVTLTTFADVPWNAPYYERFGFHVVDDARLGPGLAAVRARERTRSHPGHPRVAMVRPLRPRAVAGPPGRRVSVR